MANMLGSYTLQSTGSATSDSISIMNALALSVSQQTNDLIGPTLASKAPKNNPQFTGTVSGITADMVTSAGPSTVQQDIMKLYDRRANDILYFPLSPAPSKTVQEALRQLDTKVDHLETAVHNPDVTAEDIPYTSYVAGSAPSNVKVALDNLGAETENLQTGLESLADVIANLPSSGGGGGASATDPTFIGDVTVNPNIFGDDFATKLTLNSLSQTSATNKFSALALRSAVANKEGQAWFNEQFGLNLACSDNLPVRLNANLHVTPDRVTCLNDMQVWGNFKGDVNLLDTAPDGVVQMTIKNSADSGVARVQLGNGHWDSPTDYARMNYRNDVGLWFTTPTNNAITFCPYFWKAVEMRADKTIFYKPVEYKDQLLNNNLSLERRMADGSINIFYDKMIYGNAETNPNYWAKLVWKADGLLPAYGLQKYFNGGIDETTGDFISMFDVDKTKTTWRIMTEGTYNFSV